ncbi:MAG: chemotaxis protein CheA, partial [Verrucomicrobium sp.]|nr:ATP-binding protein [Verrucomicrobium sp.]
MSSPSDIQQRVLAAFQQEYRDQVVGIRALISAWPLTEGPVFDEAFRMAHSMKGGARVCDLPEVEKLAHELESLLSDVAKGRVAPDESLPQRMEQIVEGVEDLMGSGGSSLPVTAPSVPASVKSSPAVPASSPDSPGDAPAAVPAKKAAVSTTAHESLRIEAVHLDRLLQSSGQLVTEASRQEALGRELEDLWEEAESLRRLSEREQQLSGDLYSGLAGLTKRLQRLRTLQQRSRWSLRVLGEQQLEDVRRIGMVSISTVFEGYGRMLRDLASELGKKVEFRMTGAEAQADRAVLQMLKDPVMHALRNAIAHGIESPSRRRAEGKPEAGHIDLEISVVGQQLQIAITDDGRGVDLKAVRAQALKAGLVTPEIADLLETHQWLEQLFEARFSTSAEVTRVSGRGVGLSVVKDRVTQLQGTARMIMRPSGGSILWMEVPVSVSTHRLLLVRTAGRTFALIMRSIAQVLRVKDVHVVDGRSVIMHEGQAVPLVTLGPVAGVSPSLVRREDGTLLVALLKGERPLALSVEDFIGETSALIKALPHPASLSPHFSGAIFLDDGDVALVVHLPALVQRYLGTTL